MNKVIVLIPIYRNYLEKYEEKSLAFVSKNLSNYPIFFIAPSSLREDVDFLIILKQYNIQVIFFRNYFFDGISGYNKLMLNLDFYKYFKEFEYMLICQLDALVLSNNLTYWLEKNYDYLGAPWLTGVESHVFDSSGNGGLSLRRINKFINVLESKYFFFSESKYLSTSTRIGIKNLFLIKLFERFSRLGISVSYVKIFLYFFKLHEDYFWSMAAQYFVDAFELPKVADALKFSFEVNPRKCFEENNANLPFGCHAWQRYDLNFWIEQLDIDIK